MVKIIAGGAQKVITIDGSTIALADGTQVSVSNNPTVFTKSADSAAIDAFVRWRVSNPFTIFDSKQIFDNPDLANNVENYPLFFDNQELSGGSGTTTTFNPNRASTILAVSDATAGVRVRQTRQRFNYQSGKSQLIICTLVPGVTGSGINKRFGYFDENNGLMFQIVGGTWQVNIRTNLTGSPVNNPVDQSSWNKDNLDGTGSTNNPSGINLNKSAAQIFFIDFEWLGVGRVRFGMVIDGLIVYVHEYLNANIGTSVYMSTPNLPVRVEIENDGTGSADSIETICSTVISEGGVNPNGVIRNENMGMLAANAIQANTINTTYAVCGIRLKSQYLAAFVQEVVISFVETSGGSNPFLWQLHFNPTLTTGLTYNAVSNSAIEFGLALVAGDELIDDGTVLGGEYVSGSVKSVAASLESFLRLGSLIDGTPDEMVLSITPGTSNQRIFGSFTWKETW